MEISSKKPVPKFRKAAPVKKKVIDSFLKMIYFYSEDKSLKSNTENMVILMFVCTFILFWYH